MAPSTWRAPIWSPRRSTPTAASRLVTIRRTRCATNQPTAMNQPGRQDVGEEAEQAVHQLLHRDEQALQRQSAENRGQEQQEDQPVDAIGQRPADRHRLAVFELGLAAETFVDPGRGHRAR